MRILERLGAAILPATASAQSQSSGPYGGLGALVRHMQGAMTAAGVHMTAERAQSISAVDGCVTILAEQVGALPLITYRRQEGGGKVRAPEHWLYRLLRHRAHPDCTSIELREMMQRDVELHGVGYALKVSIRGRVAELHHLPADRVVPVHGTFGVASYEYTPLRPAGSQKRTYRANQVFRVLGPRARGGVPCSTVRRFRELFATAYAVEAFISYSFANGVRLSGVLTKEEGTLSDKAYGNLKKWVKEEYQGVTKAGKLMLLEEGLRYTATAQTNDDAKIVELWQQLTASIARVYGVPLHMLAAHVTMPRSNIEQLSREFVVLGHGLGPRLRRWQERISLDLLRDEPDVFAEFLLVALLQGDAAARSAYYNVLIPLGVLTRNEARIAENLNPLPGLDEPLTPLNMQRGAGVVAAAQVVDEMVAAGLPGETIDRLKKALAGGSSVPDTARNGRG